MESLNGKGAVITGASRGIGKAIATALAHEGMDLVLAARGRDALNELCVELTEKHGVKAHPVVMRRIEAGGPGKACVSGDKEAWPRGRADKQRRGIQPVFVS